MTLHPAIARAEALAKRHEQAAEYFCKRKAHCISAEFHRYTAQVLRELAAGNVVSE